MKNVTSSYAENKFLPTQIYRPNNKNFSKQCHYASFDKFYNLNMWIALALLYPKVKAIFALPCSAVYFYEIRI